MKTRFYKVVDDDVLDDFPDVPDFVGEFAFGGEIKSRNALKLSASEQVKFVDAVLSTRDAVFKVSNGDIAIEFVPDSDFDLGISFLDGPSEAAQDRALFYTPDAIYPILYFSEFQTAEELRALLTKWFESEGAGEVDTKLFRDLWELGLNDLLHNLSQSADAISVLFLEMNLSFRLPFNMGTYSMTVEDVRVLAALEKVASNLSDLEKRQKYVELISEAYGRAFAQRPQLILEVENPTLSMLKSVLEEDGSIPDSIELTRALAPEVLVSHWIVSQKEKVT